jgi:hypothetical protein
MKVQLRLDVGWGLVGLLALIAIAPLSAPGFFLKAHDATIGAYFLMQFDKSMADGVLYPRWAMDWTFGYGYPLFVVIAPLAFYVAQVFHLLGASIVGALKLTYALAFLLSGLSMYLFARRLFGRAGGLLAAALYIYVPYHLVDIYVRADLAEFFAFAFFPAILWAILRLNRARTRSEMARCLAAGALLYGGLILTHITMAMIVTPLALGYAVALARRREDETGTASPSAGAVVSPRLALLASLALFTLGLAIAAAYLFPGILEQRYLQTRDLVGGYYGYANHYVYPFQFLSPFWGYGYAAIGANDQMPYQLGAVAVVLAVCVLFALPGMAKARRGGAVFFLAATALVVFAMLAASQPLWDLARPLVAFIQFPWRLLSLSAVTLALAGASLVAAERSGQPQPGAWQQRGAAVLILLTVLASYPYVAPQYTGTDISLAKMIRFQLDTKELLGDTTWVTERPLDSPMVPEYLAGQAVTRAVADTQARIEVLHSGGQVFEAMVDAPAPTSVLVRIHYFPGWSAYVDGKRSDTAIRPPQGLMVVAMPAGQHRLLLRFEDTPLRRAGKLVSLGGILVALAMLAWGWRRRG